MYETSVNFFFTRVYGVGLRIGDYNFEQVQNFSYLGSQINTINSVTNEIKTRILSRNRCYYAYQNLMKSRIIGRQLKLRAYKVLIRPIVTYGCEAWTLTSFDEQLRIFERKI